MKAYLVEEQKRKEAVAAELKARVQREKQELQAKVADYQTPEWAKIEQEEVVTEEEEEAEEINEFYCVVCDKAYRSEKQFTSHESSRRHLENVEILRQEMLADEASFGNDTLEDIDSGTPLELEQISEQVDDLELEEEEETVTKKTKKKSKKKAAPRWGYDEDDIPENLDDVGALAAALEEERNRRRRKGGKSSPAIVEETPFDSNGPAVDPIPETEAVPVEKESAKTKREKRKEKKKLKEETELTEVLDNTP